MLPFSAYQWPPLVLFVACTGNSAIHNDRKGGAWQADSIGCTQLDLLYGTTDFS